MSTSGYEKIDVDIKKVFIASLVPAIIVVLSSIGLNYYFLYEQTKEESFKSSIPDPELTEAYEQQQAQLKQYQILNRQEGTYRIPVERAMEIIANQQHKGARAK